ncbi:MAG: CYTH domain-containing protein [Spirochaetaceae bacterium]|jgi:adenylate cyclase class 2|nr:CYTH domain-containing protein [Spirochaetaceae bacterium]
MAVEIELKARVESPETQKEVISTLAEYAGSFEKDDSYWFPPPGMVIPPGGPSSSGVRIRREKFGGPPGELVRRVWVTYKSRERREGIEVNHEGEFEVSDGAVFEGFLSGLGFTRGAGKRKRGWAWTFGDITAELSLVEGLGWFVELEILTGNDREETVAAARERLLDFLRKIGVGEDRIESRYYTEMLREAGSVPPGV